LRFPAAAGSTCSAKLAVAKYRIPIIFITGLRRHSPMSCGRSEQLDSEPDRAEQIVEGLADRRVIVDDDDGGWFLAIAVSRPQPRS